MAVLWLLCYVALESGVFSVNKPKYNPAAVAEFSVSLCNAPKFRYFGRPGLLFRAPQLGSYTGTELQLGIPEFSEPGPGPGRDSRDRVLYGTRTGTRMGTKLTRGLCRRQGWSV